MKKEEKASLIIFTLTGAQEVIHLHKSWKVVSAEIERECRQI